ncbi:hypothetical protein KIW84_061326 [Lathyrus oleraceus]|uniref:ATPase AAA-type core domain-containing protein n=1 Tax=Pisum sativum TaxID=3888 RepID=A0A9D5A423_PEA|nr:hypothetical protein KIW84_061326 [Pisum sativum]
MDDMDMMDMEELELLESSYRIYEQEDDNHYLYNPPEDEPELQPEQSPPDLASPSEPQSNSHKRSRSDPNSDLDSDSADVEKREKVRVRAEDPPADEDWLRYSPPPSPVRAEEVRLSKEKTLSRFASEIDGEVMPVTAPNGDRVYTKLDRYYGEDRATKLNSGEFSSDLALEPISVLFERLEEETFAKTLEASSESQSVVDVPETLTLHEKLWVDKYAPKSFTDLLSDEQTNREVLLWLKQWDSTVFGSEIRSTSEDVLSALKRHSSISHSQKPLGSGFPRTKGGHVWSNNRYTNSRSMEGSNNRYTNSRSMEGSDNSMSSQDTHNTMTRHIGAPEQKILLLCGPPGLGKTTLAHVAARHCGYHVVECSACSESNSNTQKLKELTLLLESHRL